MMPFSFGFKTTLNFSVNFNLKGKKNALKTEKQSIICLQTFGTDLIVTKSTNLRLFVLCLLIMFLTKKLVQNGILTVYF